MGKDGTSKSNGGGKASCGHCHMGGGRFPSRRDIEQDDTEGDRECDQAHSVLYLRMQACTPGLHGGPQRSSAAPHLPHLCPFQLCLDTIVHNLDSDLTVRHLWPQERGSHQHRLLSLRAPKVPGKGMGGRSRPGAQDGAVFPGMQRPGSPGGWGAAEDPADILTATVGEGVDTPAELARHLQDKGVSQPATPPPSGQPPRMETLRDPIPFPSPCFSAQLALRGQGFLNFTSWGPEVPA